MPAPLSRFQAIPTVKINGQVNDRVALLSASVSVMSRVPDQCTFEVRDLDSKRSTELSNKAMTELLKNDECEVLISTRTPGVSQIVHFGRIVAMDASIENGETITYTSRLDEHLFGDPVETILVGTRPFGLPDTAAISNYTPVTIDGELRFNPVYESITTPNRSASIIGGLNHHVFIDHGSVDAYRLHEDRRAGEDGGGQNHNGVVNFWTVAQAVTYLCWTLNEAEQYVRNPTLGEVEDAIGTEWDNLRDVTISIGDYLPKALDELLWSRGYGWRIEYSDGQRKIVAYKRGEAEHKVIKLQSWGSVLDTDETNVAALRANMDYSDGVANQVSVLGGFEEYEMTIILRPAWNPKYDSETILSKFNTAHHEDDLDIAQVWRRYAANEAGQYTDSAKFHSFWTKALDLTGVIGADGNSAFKVLRKRRLLPTISVDKAGASIAKSFGVYLEWYDPSNQTWNPVWGGVKGKGGLTNGNFKVLQDEMGIYFGDQDPPHQLRSMARRLGGADKLFLRVTATVKSDVRMRGVRVANSSHLKDPKKQVIDAHNQYEFHQRLPGILANVPGIGSPIGGSFFQIPKAAETFGQYGAEKRAEELIEKYNAANISGQAVIEGVDWPLMDYLGNVVEKIKGRELTLRTSPTESQTVSYPTVNKIDFDIQRQKTTLQFEALR